MPFRTHLANLLLRNEYEVLLTDPIAALLLQVFHCAGRTEATLVPFTALRAKVAHALIDQQVPRCEDDYDRGAYNRSKAAKFALHQFSAFVV